MNGQLSDLARLLASARELGASDVLIDRGYPAAARVNGQLTPLSGNVPWAGERDSGKEGGHADETRERDVPG